MSADSIAVHGIDRRHHLIVREMADGSFLFVIGTDTTAPVSLVRVTEADALELGQWLVRRSGDV